MWIEPIRRCLVGSVSGIAASLVKYWTHDHNTVLGMISASDWDKVLTFALGYGVGLAVLMLLGAIAAWISNETDFRKLFFVGLSAPAMFAAGISTPPPPVANPSLESLAGSKKASWHMEFGFIQTAYADDDSEDCIGDTAFTKGMKTFFGVTPPKYDRYRVIVWSTKDPKNAATKAKAVNAEDPTIKATVGKRACDSEYYPVIVGDYLPLADAKDLRERAVGLRSVEDAYLSAGPR